MFSASSRILPVRRSLPFVGLFLLIALLAVPSVAQPIEPVEPLALDLHWRLVGPHRGGWATAVAGVPGDPATFYFGSANGGVWRTDDAGSNWEPIFDGPEATSIGALAVAPSDPQVLWAGTGQIHQRWDIVEGSGVYRSTDSGSTWQHVGLEDSRHIGAIWVDPRDADVALVAALGHVFGPNEERGLFRTDDGGATWQRVLFLDSDSGGDDVTGSADTPDVLYGSLWQVRRHPWLDYFQPTVGPGSGIYRSADAGKTWAKVAGAGLPEEPLGRIELAVAPGSGGEYVWAAVETADGGGLYWSEDSGASWRLINEDAESVAGSYMSCLYPHPSDPSILWAVGRGFRISHDGGRTFEVVRAAPGGDDYHTLWLDPTNPDHLITGADQGAVITLNAGRSWSSWYNQPTGQFYRLAVDEQFPYRIYSGQQDSGTVSIASRSDYGQITFRDWHPVGADERDGDVPFPGDPNIVFGAGLGGRITKWNARTGQSQNVAPWPVSSYAARPGTTKYRYDWITPLAISKPEPHAIYVGAQVLFRSLDQGASWQTISPDLSGTDPSATGCDGNVPFERTSACGWGTIFSIAPSPIKSGVVWVGSTDGRVHLTRDDGGHWADVTPPGLAPWSKIHLIDASSHDAGTAYLAVDRHRSDEYRPIAYRTHDFGASWTEIGHGLPDGQWLAVVRQDTESPGLLFAGTSRGAYASLDDGETWRGLQLDLPRTGINDLLVHRGDVIVATEGRAIWVLDDVTPLRHLADASETGAVELAQPSTAWRLRFNQNHDTPLPPDVPTGENPPTGAVFDYFLGDEVVGPVTIGIFDDTGKVVRSFHSDEPSDPRTGHVYFADEWLGEPAGPVSGPGHHRFVWDLRFPPPPCLEADYSIAAVPGKETPLLPSGAFVLRGTYEVRLSAGGHTVSRSLDVLMDPRVHTDQAELAELLDFQRQVAAALEQAVTRAEDTSDAIASSVARHLTSLAVDLEAVDARPTAPQRALLAEELARLEGE